MAVGLGLERRVGLGRVKGETERWGGGKRLRETGWGDDRWDGGEVGWCRGGMVGVERRGRKGKEGAGKEREREGMGRSVILLQVSVFESPFS